MTAITTPVPDSTALGEALLGFLVSRNILTDPAGAPISPATSDAQALALTALQALLPAIQAITTALGGTLHEDGAVTIAGVATAAKQDAAFAQNAPFGGRVAMTVDTAVTAGRAIEIVASAAGNVALTFADGSATIVAVAAGTTILDYAVTTVNTNGTTATATYGKLV